MSKLKLGDKAPDFEAVSDDGTTVRLRDLKGQKVILYFYPRDDTSGCTAQACAFRDHYPQVEASGAVVLGVSPDGIESHQKFKKKYDLPFPLLVDPNHQIAEKFGVWGEKSMYGRKYMGVIRSHFVIDEEGAILDAQYKISPKKSAAVALGKI